MDTNIIKLNSAILFKSEQAIDAKPYEGFLPKETDRIQIILDDFWYIRCYDKQGNKIASVRLEQQT